MFVDKEAVSALWRSIIYKLDVGSWRIILLCRAVRLPRMDLHFFEDDSSPLKMTAKIAAAFSWYRTSASLIAIRRMLVIWYDATKAATRAPTRKMLMKATILWHLRRIHKRRSKELARRSRCIVREMSRYLGRHWIASRDSRLFRWSRKASRANWIYLGFSRRATRLIIVRSSPNLRSLRYTLRISVGRATSNLFKYILST